VSRADDLATNGIRFWRIFREKRLGQVTEQSIGIAHDIADLDLISRPSVANVGIDREGTSGVAEDVVGKFCRDFGLACDGGGHVARRWRGKQRDE